MKVIHCGRWGHMLHCVVFCTNYLATPLFTWDVTGKKTGCDVLLKFVESRVLSAIACTIIIVIVIIIACRHLLNYFRETFETKWWKLELGDSTCIWVRVIIGENRQYSSLLQFWILVILPLIFQGCSFFFLLTLSWLWKLLVARDQQTVDLLRWRIQRHMGLVKEKFTQKWKLHIS